MSKDVSADSIPSMNFMDSTSPYSNSSIVKVLKIWLRQAMSTEGWLLREDGFCTRSISVAMDEDNVENIVVVSPVRLGQSKSDSKAI